MLVPTEGRISNFKPLGDILAGQLRIFCRGHSGAMSAMGFAIDNICGNDKNCTLITFHVTYFRDGCESSVIQALGMDEECAYVVLMTGSSIRLNAARRINAARGARRSEHVSTV